jgi:hypothetical protein
MPGPCVIIAGHEGDILYRHKICLGEPDQTPSEAEFFTEAMKAALDHGAIQEEKLADYIVLMG